MGVVPSRRGGTVWPVLAAVAVPALIALLLSGCTPAVPAHHPAATPRSTATPHRTAAPDPMRATFSGTAVRADFSAADGSRAGTLLITATHGQYEATIDGFAGHGGQLNLHLGRTKEDTCSSSGYEIGASEPLMQKTGFTAPVPFHPEQALNPDVFKVAAISDGDSTDPESGCVYNLLATATLNWQVPNTVPTFAAHDSGPRNGATGTVTLTPTGQPEAYVVADGDSINSITQRFDISAQQLWYLNPTRNSGESSIAQTGETLNLDLQNR